MNDPVINYMKIADCRADRGIVRIQIAVTINESAFAGVPIGEWPEVVRQELMAAEVARVDIAQRTCLVDKRNGEAER